MVTLAGCAATPTTFNAATHTAFDPASATFNHAWKAHQDGDYHTAIDHYLKCARQEKNPACMNNMGYMFEHGQIPSSHPMETAIKWYTQAANYGHPVAVNNLRAHSQPAPSSGIAPQQQANNGGDTGAFLAFLALSFLSGMNQGGPVYVPQPAPQQTYQPPKPSKFELKETINCTSMTVSPDFVSTHCR
jgi:TPR repeat protein